MKNSRFWYRIAYLLRRFKFIMVIVHIIMRIFQPKVTIGVVGLVYNENNEILLVEHVFHPQKPWGLPGGWISAGELPEEGVKRELMEELQLDVEIVDLLLIGRTFRNHLDFAYLCRPNGQIGTLSFELLGYRWYDPMHTPALITFHRRAIAKFLELQPVREY